MSDARKTVLVTGAAGFIGYHLSKAIIEAGGTVVGYDNINDYYDVNLKCARLSELEKYDEFTFVRGDLADAEGVNRLFEDARPDVVVNLAAQAGVRYSMVNPRAYIDSNIVGFFNILEACRNHPVEHLLYASSSSVYGNQKKTPFSVGDSVDKPISLYAATKKADELMAYSYSYLYGIPATGLRFFTVYGPYGRPDLACYKFAERIMAGQAIEVYNHGDMLRDFTYIDDIVEGVMRMLGSPPAVDEDGARSRVYNIGNNRPENLLHFIETLERCLGREAKKEFLPMQQADVYQTYADIDDIEADFGYRPTTRIDEGLKKFADWFLDYHGCSR